MCPCKDKQSPKDHSIITVSIPPDFSWLFNGVVNKSDYISLMIMWCLMKNWKIQTVHFIVSLKRVLSHRKRASDGTSRGSCRLYGRFVTAHAQCCFYHIVQP